MRTIRLRISKEEKVADKITTLLSDFTLDLEAIGFYLAKAGITSDESKNYNFSWEIERFQFHTSNSSLTHVRGNA